MEGSPQHHNDQGFNDQDWHLRARIGRENTSSRRYSASYIRRSFREDTRRSFKSNFTVSSTASSPGYNLKDEIDPSTYSFTTALKALQAKSGYVWEYYSPEGFALNSKWDEAERYICNPLSGEVPMECLSANTLSARSFRNNMASRVTMSAPLVYSIQPIRTSATTTTTNKPPPFSVVKDQLLKLPTLGQEEKELIKERRTRDIGIQSSPPDDSSSSPSSASTPSIKERMIKRFEESQETEDGDAQNSSSIIRFNPVEQYKMQVEVKVTREGEETKRRTKKSEQKKEKKTGQFYICRPIKGCLHLPSWSSLSINKRRERQNTCSK